MSETRVDDLYKLHKESERRAFNRLQESGEYAGTNKHGEEIRVINEQEEGMVIDTIQEDGWVRKEKYDSEGKYLGELERKYENEYWEDVKERNDKSKVSAYKSGSFKVRRKEESLAGVFKVAMFVTGVTIGLVLLFTLGELVVDKWVIDCWVTGLPK